MNANLTEQNLLLKLSCGDDKAFTALYQAYRERVYAGAYKLLKSHEQAQEILQDVFMKVWLNRASANTVTNFKSYLYTVTRNTVYDHFRKIANDSKKIEEFILEATLFQPASVEQTMAYKELEGRLALVLEKMPQKCREVFVLCKIEGRSYKEVSEMLNISTATINNHIVKASRILKANWEPEYLSFFLFLYFT